MSLQLIETITEGDRTAKVYRDTEWNEYRVKLYEDGAHLTQADYHTDDETDALATAKTMVQPK